MYNLLKFFAFRHLSSKLLRNTLTGIGVALGVALYVSIHLINQSTLQSFEENISSLSGNADLTVTSSEVGFAEAKIEELRALPGVKYAVPMIESRAYYRLENQKFESLVILGIDLLAEGTVRSYKTEGEDIMEDPLVFFNQPDSIILSKIFADQHGLKVDDRIQLSTALGDRYFTIRGILIPQGPAKAYGGAIALMDIDGARISFGRGDKVDRVDLILKPESDKTKIQASVEKFEGNLRAEDSDTQMENSRQMVASFQGMLSFLSSLALVVAIFIVGNIVSVSVQERRRDIGALRSLGATRSGILISILLESALIGAISSLAGAILGFFLAQKLLITVVASLSSQLLTQISVPHLIFRVQDCLFALAFGVAATVMAALWPAITATRISPIEALRPAGTELSQLSSLSRFWRTVPWIGLIILGYLCALSATRQTKIPQIAELNPILGLTAVGFLAPPLVFLLIKLLRRISGASVPIVIRLSLENLLRTPSRTFANCLSLMIGLVLVGIIATVNLSFKTTLLTWAARVSSIGGAVVSSNGRIADFRVQPIHEDLKNQISAVEGVDHTLENPVFGMRFLRTNFEGRTIALKAFDHPGRGRNFDFIDALDRSSQEAGELLYDGNVHNTLVSDTFIQHFSKKVGDTVSLDTPSGLVNFKIGGIVRDFANPEGVIYLPRTVYKSLWKDPLVTAFGVAGHPEISPLQLQKNLDAVVGKDLGLMTTLTTELISDLDGIIQQNFKLTQAIEFAALLVGLFGLLNTFFISILERKREIGLLRSVGTSRQQLLSMIILEATTLGLLSGIVSGFFGITLAYLWTTRTMSDLLGWQVKFQVPKETFIGVILLGTLVAIIASLFPALKAVRIQIREALEYE